MDEVATKTEFPRTPQDITFDSSIRDDILDYEYSDDDEEIERKFLDGSSQCSDDTCIDHVSDEDDTNMETESVLTEETSAVNDADCEDCFDGQDETETISIFKVPFRKIARCKFTSRYRFRPYFVKTGRIQGTDRLFASNINPIRNSYLETKALSTNIVHFKDTELDTYVRKLTNVCIVVDNQVKSEEIDECIAEIESFINGDLTMNDMKNDNSPDKNQSVTVNNDDLVDDDSTSDDDVTDFSIIVKNNFRTIENYDSSSQSSQGKSIENELGTIECKTEEPAPEDNEVIDADTDSSQACYRTVVNVDEENDMNEDPANDLDFSITVTNNPCDTPDTQNDLSDIAIVIDNTPAKAEKNFDSATRCEHLSAFQRICHRHFISENCNRKTCQLLHIIPRNFQEILLNFDFTTMMKAYEWVKGTLLFEHTFQYFSNALVYLKKDVELCDMIDDIFKQSCQDRIECVRVVIKALEAMDQTFQEAVDFIILRHGISDLALCDSLLKIISGRPNLQENWYLVKKLIMFRSERIQSSVVMNMVCGCLGESTPNLSLIRNINEFIFRKNLVDLEPIPNVFLNGFYKVLGTSS